MKLLIFSAFSLLATTTTASIYDPNILLPRQTDYGSSSNTTGDTSTNNTSVTTASSCSTNMCINATLSGSTIQYVLSSTGSRTPGWMGIGFGSQMSGSPMVILWSNSDGTITLSQRQASGHNPPTVVSNPARVATLEDSLSSTSGDIKYAFSIPSDGSTNPTLIWAFSSTNPGSSSTSATIVQHSDMGVTSLNLSGGSSGSSGSSESRPLTSYEMKFVAHAILCTLGYLLFLPIGALLSRYFRTFTSVWFKAHWAVQVFAGTVIIAGVAVGIQGVSDLGGEHLDDTHMRLGVALFVLYFVQCSLGAVIHFFKPSKSAGRPPQNYLHAVLGLLIIALALYQVRTGYRNEWPRVSGRGAVSNGVNIIWYIWVVLLPVLYFVGLAFLPKQLRQERQSRASGGKVGSNAL